MPRPIKYDVKQDADLHIRLTAEQKQQLVMASMASQAGTIAPFIHQLAEHVAPLFIDLNQGKIEPEVFKAEIANVMFNLASPSPSPEPEPEEGEDGD